MCFTLYMMLLLLVKASFSLSFLCRALFFCVFAGYSSWGEHNITLGCGEDFGHKILLQQTHYDDTAKNKRMN